MIWIRLRKILITQSQRRTHKYNQTSNYARSHLDHIELQHLMTVYSTSGGIHTVKYPTFSEPPPYGPQMFWWNRVDLKLSPLSGWLGQNSPPQGSEKGAERGRGPQRAREGKKCNVCRVVVPANVPVIRNYPILSIFFRKLTRAVHRRGIYSRTAIRTAFPPSWHSTMPAWMHYSGNSIWRLIYSRGLQQGESVLSIRAGEIQFDDD